VTGTNIPPVVSHSEGRLFAGAKAMNFCFGGRHDSSPTRSVLETLTSAIAAGRSRTDKTAREELAASARDIQTREDERRQALAVQQDR